jgi:hypothetical protein
MGSNDLPYDSNSMQFTIDVWVDDWTERKNVVVAVQFRRALFKQRTTDTLTVIS